MHHQIWYTHCGQEVPEWVYAFWKCKPVKWVLPWSIVNFEFLCFSASIDCWNSFVDLSEVGVSTWWQERCYSNLSWLRRDQHFRLRPCSILVTCFQCWIDEIKKFIFNFLSASSQIVRSLLVGLYTRNIVVTGLELKFGKHLGTIIDYTLSVNF